MRLLVGVLGARQVPLVLQQQPEAGTPATSSRPEPGATLRELMDRMGHSTTRAALIYLHGSDQRQREIAQALSHLARSELKGHPSRTKGRGGRKSSGTQRARGRRDVS